MSATIDQASLPPISVRSNPLTIARLGVLPFFIFAGLFLIIPTLYLVVGAFQDQDGNLTLNNLAHIFSNEKILEAYWISIKISLASAIGGAVLGFFVAHAIVMGGLPGWLRPAITTFSGVASNFAGVPLAFAFIATIGPQGLITIFLRNGIDVGGEHLALDLRAAGFNILSFWGLTLTYLYFQIPLMVLILTPALDGLKREWREATATLGGSAVDFWRYVGLPVLWPSLMGATLLLFANSFGAIATAYALTGSSLNIITIQLYAQIRGDVLHDQNLGYALALGMIIITGGSNAIYIWLRHRSERWLR
ncbi:MAG: ABC transporter permease subunit [Ancalomicrobiaceae bacterium]|nr:ABC transporter permease subunit [Ancalomicrobiaceae bacterium]